MKVAVIGLGYVGLTVFGASVGSGHETYGYDLSETRRQKVESMILSDKYLLDGYLYLKIRENMNNGHLSSIYDENLRNADVKVVCVDTINVPNAVQMIGQYIKTNDIVIIESTFSVEICDVVKDLLERNSDKKVGSDFVLGFVPERVMEGRLLENFENMPRPIGTYSRSDFKRIEMFYKSLGVRGGMHYTDPRHAAAAKDFENAFRFLEISIANEFADICREKKLDFEEIRRLVNIKGRVLGFNEILQSGIGIGGPCIPMAADIVAKMNWDNANLLRTAIELNIGRQHSIARTLESMLKKKLGDLAEKKIAFLGATYRPNGVDSRDSPAVEIIVKLAAGFAPIYIYDPLWSGGDHIVESRLPREDEAFDAVVILVGHDAFADLSSINCKYFIDLTGVVKKYPKKARHERLRV